MGRKPRVDRSLEEKWQIVQKGIKSGNVSETCRRHGIARQLETDVGAEVAGDRNPKKTSWGSELRRNSFPGAGDGNVVPQVLTARHKDSLAT